MVEQEIEQKYWKEKISRKEGMMEDNLGQPKIIGIGE
jgi:hypothetical protein